MKQITFQKNAIITLLITSLVVALIAFVPFYSHTADAKVKKSVNLSCMQTAIDTREDAIGDAFESFNDDVEAALAVRKTALHDAWGLTDKVARTTAVKNAWKTWKTDHKSAHSELKSERKAAWATFKTTAKSSCKETLPKEETLSGDASGSLSL